MKHLRQYIRQILLTEGMNTPDMLPDYVMVVIKQTAPEYFMVYYGYKDNPNQVVTKGSGAVMGRVTMGKPSSNHGNCGGAMKIGHARAQHGWGPMLYDVAMEHATQIANGLIADRDSVSDDATNVWNYYLNNRSDVVAHQLDNLSNVLTTPEDDNCNQSVADNNDIEAVTNTIFSSMGIRGENNPKDNQWVKSPLSKRYTKEPTTINTLKAAGKLVIL